MLLQFIYRKHRRAVSPAVATVLVIALALSAGVVVVTLLNNLDQSSLEVDSDTDIGSFSGGGADVTPPAVSITGIERNSDLVSVGINDYVKLTVDVENLHPESIYIMDIDVILFGIKLDEIAPWQITSPISGGASSIELAPNEKESFTVQLSDDDKLSTPQARIPANTTFSYEVVYGSAPNLVSGSIIKEQQARELFAPVWFNVAILHHGAAFASTDAAAQYENSLATLNGTNKVYFNYSRSVDAYDYGNNPSSIAAQDIVNNYDIVIVDVWAVPAAISSAIQQIHANQTSLIFYGSVSVLGNNQAEVLSAIDLVATEQITGLTPLMYSGPQPEITDHRYEFYTGSSILKGLDGVKFEETEDDSWVSVNGEGGFEEWSSGAVCGTTESYTGLGDDQGYDIANMTATGNFIEYGSATWNFVDGSPQSIPPYPQSTTLLVEKYNDTSFGFNKSLVYSFVWKHNNAIHPNTILVDNSQLRQIRTNMLAEMASQSERVVTRAAGASIDSFSIIPPVYSIAESFDMTVSGTIKNVPVQSGELTISIDMPNAYNFTDCTPSMDADGWFKSEYLGSFEVNGVEVVRDDIVVVIGAENVVTIDVSEYYSGDLAVGDTFKLKFERNGFFTNFFAINPADTNYYNWTVTVDTGPAFTTSRQFLRSVDDSADNEEPDPVNDLAVAEVTSDTVELSWSQPQDNGGGYVASYKILRDGVVIDSNVQTTSYIDYGLGSGNTYEYRVIAVDNSGIESVPSNAVNGTTLTGTPPPNVDSLTANALSSRRIELTWPAMANVDGYWLFQDGSGPVKINDPQQTSYIYTQLEPATTYDYEIYAVNNSILSDTPATATGTTADPPSAQIWVSQIDLDYTRRGGFFFRYYTLEVIFTVSDINGVVQNTNVAIPVTYSIDGAPNVTTTISGTTNSQGQISVDVGQVDDSFALTIQDIINENYTYDPSSGVRTINDTNPPTDKTYT